MEIKKRNLVTVLLLLIVTIGIYGIVLMTKINKETRSLEKGSWSPSGTFIVLVTVITFPIYWIYWSIKMATRIGDASKDETAKILMIVFSVFTLFVGLVLMVHYLNGNSTSKGK